MAATKTASTLLTSQVLTAGSTLTSAIMTGAADYGAVLYISIVNGATGPTTAASAQIKVSPEGATFYDYGGPLVGTTSNNGSVTWGGISIPFPNQYAEVVLTGNTAQNVTVEVKSSQVTAV